MMALFDQDMMARHDPHSLLRRSAEFVGTMLADSVYVTKTCINKDIALCITGRGPWYKPLCDLQQNKEMRRKL